LPPKVHISEIGTPLAGATKHKKNADFPLDPQFPKDFPVVMQVCKKYGLLFLVTKMGFFYAYEITQTQLLYKTRISDSPVFVGARDSKEDGIYVIAKNGNVILTRAEKSALLPYLLQNC
jgi:clathrin heavy chain